MWFLGMLDGLGGKFVRFFTMCSRGYDVLFGLVVGALIVLVGGLQMVMCGGGVVSCRGQMSCSGRMLGNRPLIGFSTSGLRRRCHVCDPL